MSEKNARRGLFTLSLEQSIKWGSGLAVFSGVVSDVLKPLAPFTAYIAFAAATAAVILLIAVTLKYILLEDALAALVFAIIIAVISGGFYFWQRQAEAKNGILAEYVPVISELQTKLGLVEAKIKEIEQTSQKAQQAATEAQSRATAVEEKTTALEGRVRDTEQRTEALATSLAEVTRRYQTLGVETGLVDNARTPDQFYHNARLRELFGDGTGARRDYIAFLDSGLDVIDPVNRLAALLLAQEGREGARRILNDLAEKYQTRALRLASLQTLDNAAQTAALEKFIADNPDFLPAQYVRARVAFEGSGGTQTLSGLAIERQGYQAFLSGESNGALASFFIDQTELADWIGKARARLTALQAMPTAKPMLTATFHPGGWMLTVGLPEPALAISYRLGSAASYTDAEMLGFINPQTGKPIPDPTIKVAVLTKPTVVSVKYTDARGEVAGPFEFTVDPAAELTRGLKQQAQLAASLWVRFGDGSDRDTAYFAGLAVFSCAIGEVRYGFDGGPMDKAFPLPPCNLEKPFDIPQGFPLAVRIPGATSSLALQVHYKDGTSSPVQIFNR